MKSFSTLPQNGLFWPLNRPRASCALMAMPGDKEARMEDDEGVYPHDEKGAVDEADKEEGQEEGVSLALLHIVVF